MRLTSVVYKLNYLRLTRRLWKKWGKMQIKDIEIPPELQESGVKIKDAREILLETQLFKPEPPEEKVRAMPPSVLQYGRYIYLMNHKTKVSENENQTLVLTKTVPHSGLPDGISRLIGIDRLPDQDKRIETSILQSLVWDAIQDKLPKKVDVKRPGYVFRREYGIRYKRKTSNLLEKFSFHCDAVTGRYLESLHRIKVIDAFSEISINKEGSDVIFQMPCDILITSKRPLKAFASPSDVVHTKNQPLPSIYPIKSTLDLDKYDESPLQQEDAPLDYGFTDNLHTILIAHKTFGFWFPKQLLARAIATCFSFAALEAKKRYSVDVKELPEPICVQCAYMDVKSFNFLAYQLNTLDLSHSGGIKNQVWIDQPSDLYENVSENEGITGYNNTVFPKLLALYMNGLHLET